MTRGIYRVPVVDIKELDDVQEEPGARTPFEKRLRERCLLGAARRIVARYGLLVDELVLVAGVRSTEVFTSARTDFARHLQGIGWSTPMIARLLGYRDHTTIIRLLRPKDPK